MWYGGTLTSVASSSSALANSKVANTYDTTWRWRSTAALGSPVVPDVNSMTAVASVSGKPSGAVASSGADTRASTAFFVTTSRPATPETRATMSSSTMTVAGAARSAMRASSASVRR